MVNGRHGTVWVAGERALVALRPRRRPRAFPVDGYVGALARGHKGRPWFTQISKTTGATTIAKLTAGGTLRPLIRLPQDAAVTAMARGPGRRVWFADMQRRRLGFVTRAGRIRYVGVTFGQRGRPRDIAIGPDAAAWVTDSSGAILRVRPSGRVQRFRLRNVVVLVPADPRHPYRAVARAC